VVQDSLGADQETAERATRAVASVLGERIGADKPRVLATVGEAAREEFFDVAVQLHGGYRDLIAGPAHR
jgi:hypothetical protein